MGNINASVKLPDNFVMRSDNDAETLFKERLLGFSDEDFESLKKFTDLKIKSYAYNKDYESYILFAQFNLKKLSKVMKKNITNASDFYKLLGTNEIRVKEQSLNGIDVVSEESGYGKISHYAIKGNQCFFVVISIPHRENFKIFGLGKDPEDKISESLKFGTHGIIDGFIDGAFVLIKAPVHLFFKDVRIFATANNGFSYILGVILGLAGLLALIVAIYNA